MIISGVKARRYARPKTLQNQLLRPLTCEDMSIDLCLSLLFHPGEADDIQALQHMRTMGRVTKDDDVVGTGVEQQLMCIMRAMPIHEEDMCATFGLVFCLHLKVN